LEAIFGLAHPKTSSWLPLMQVRFCQIAHDTVAQTPRLCRQPEGTHPTQAAAP
jgi:hypothetical protein